MVLVLIVCVRGIVGMSKAGVLHKYQKNNYFFGFLLLIFNSY